MTTDGWLTLVFFGALLAISTPLLGNYMAKVYGNRAAPGDRFFLPMGGKMDWIHTLRRTDEGTEVGFDVSVSGPTAFFLGPIMRKILAKDLPPTVDKLVLLAERSQRRGGL